MGSKERRERERSEQRQRILDAALQIITKEGFAALSMRKLAEKIEYSPASIYLYFRNREQLAQELSEVGFNDLLLMLSAAAGLPRAIDALHAMGAAYVKYGIGNPAMYRLIFMGDSEFIDAAFGNQSKDSAGVRAYGVLLDVARRLQSDGVMKNVPLIELAELIWTALHGIVSLRIGCSRMKLTPPERLARLATETIASVTGD
jgi:AcrR family transcriptional regulator